MLGLKKLGLVKSAIIGTLLLGASFNSLATTSEDYEKALRAYNVSEYDEAYIHLKNSLQKDPENLAAKILMGRILLINGYLVAAEQEFTEALSMGADINLLAEPLGNTWLFLNKYKDITEFNHTEKLSGENKRDWLQITATACVRLEDLFCAKSEYSKILNDYPTHVPAMNGLASIALQQDNPDLARNYISRAEAIDSENAITWRLKGQLAYLEGDTQSATEFLQQALTFNREDPIALRNLVDLYLQAKDYDRARLFVAEIIEDTPNDPLAILLNSWLESRQAEEIIDNEKLEQLNEFMAQLSPELIASQPMLLYISGLTNFFNNNMEKAAKDFSSYLQQESDDIQAVMMLSQVYLATQQYKQALILLEKHQTALLENPESALILGDLFIRQNKAFKAERLLQRLELRYPDNPKLQLFKIKLMAARGKQQEALAILDNSFEQNKGNSSFLFAYSLMHLQSQDFEKSLLGARLLTEMFPDEAEVYNLQAGILIRQGKLEEAKQAIEKAGIPHDHVTFVETDFNQETWMDTLLTSGFDPNKTTYILWEGVTMYLTDEAVNSTLALFSTLPQGSVISIDFFTEDMVKGNPPHETWSKRAHAAIKYYSEKIMFGIPTGESLSEGTEQLASKYGLILSKFENIGDKDHQKKIPWYVFTEFTKI